MSQDFTLGRCGLATASGGDGLELKCSGWEQSGDEVKASGVIRGQTSVGAVNALRAQLSGYHLNTDEPVVPVTWVNDPSVDGFYRVQSVEVSEEVTGRMKASPSAGALAYRWSADLLRVPGWQAPLFEIVSTGAHRGGGSVTTGDPWVALPLSSGLTSNFAAISGAIPSNISVVGDNGTAVVLYTPSDELYNATVNYYAETSTFCKVACGIEVTFDSGSTWRTLVGRQIPADADGWRLTNHITRVSIVGNDLRVERYDSGAAAWEATDFTPTQGATGAVTLFADGVAAPTVLHNRIDLASVQVLCRGMVRVQLTVRRGGTLIEGRTVAPSSLYPDVFGIYRDASEAGTSITGGIEATSANASGNKYIMLSQDAITKDVTGTSGIELTAAATQFRFAIGVSNADIASGFTATEAYFAANVPIQRIVAF